MAKYEVGQTVWLVPLQRYAGEARSATVTKVGRKWVGIGERSRFDPETGYVDGGGYSPSARIWPSKAAHEAYVERQTAWSKIRSTIQHTYNVPDHLTADEIGTLSAILTPHSEEGAG